MTDLTKLTVDELAKQMLPVTMTPKQHDAWLEVYRRAQANDLVQAERDEFDEELHTCRAIVRATSEHLHVDLEEMVDKLRRTEADAHSWQELATARAQANDALRSAAEVAAKTMTTKSLKALRAALAAAPAPSSSGASAPADSQREAVIGSWRERMIRECEQGDAFSAVFLPTAARDLIDEAVSLMRSAPPAPVDQDAKLRDAVAALETVATKQQKVELRDAAHRILQGYSPCMNCGKWARRSECHWPCNPIGKAPPAPVAPVTDARIAVAIDALEAAAFHHGDQRANRASSVGEEYNTEAARRGARETLDRLIARRVAEARGAGLRKDAVKWIVNDIGELGVEIHGQSFFLYKGESLVYDDGKHDDGAAMMVRYVGKREFGECCHPMAVLRNEPWDIHYVKGEAVRPLLAAPPATTTTTTTTTENAKLRELLVWADNWSRDDKHGPDFRSAFGCVAGQIRFLLGEALENNKEAGK